MHPNYYKDFFLIFFFIQYKKIKMPRLSTKERKAKFNTNNLIFRKKTLIYLQNTTIFIKLC